MVIEHIYYEMGGMFNAIQDGMPVGSMHYSWAGTYRIAIDSTEVPYAFSGQGIGKKLLLAAVSYARDNDLEILPVCPFARAMFNKMPELRDVLQSSVVQNNY